jgi:putative ATPase
MADVRDRYRSVPAHLRDAHYPGAAKLGHGQGYVYPHDTPQGWVEQQYRPEELDGASEPYWHPTGRGADVDRRPGTSGSG